MNVKLIKKFTKLEDSMLEEKELHHRERVARFRNTVLPQAKEKMFAIVRGFKDPDIKSSYSLQRLIGCQKP